MLNSLENNLKHVRLARACWKDVPPKEVLPGLSTWCGKTTCGTAACFGGWLPSFPAFAELGVTRDPDDGSPRMLDPDDAKTYVPPFTLSRLLFGDEGMAGTSLFDVAGLWPCDEGQPDEHAMVAARLKTQEAYLERLIGKVRALGLDPAQVDQATAQDAIDYGV